MGTRSRSCNRRGLFRSAPTQPCKVSFHSATKIPATINPTPRSCPGAGRGEGASRPRRQRRDPLRRSPSLPRLAFLDPPSLLVVHGVRHDLAPHLLFPDLNVDLAPDLVQILADFRKPQRLSIEVRRLDRLRDEADLFSVHEDVPARGLVAAALEDDAREPKLRRVLVPLERLAALEVSLPEVDRPPEPTLERRDGRVVLDAADDEAALDPEEVERDHPDHLHPLGLGVL